MAEDWCTCLVDQDVGVWGSSHTLGPCDVCDDIDILFLVIMSIIQLTCPQCLKICVFPLQQLSAHVCHVT